MNANCPKCGLAVGHPQKSWELKGGKSKKKVVVGMYLCSQCNKSFRAAHRETLGEGFRGAITGKV